MNFEELKPGLRLKWDGDAIGLPVAGRIGRGTIYSVISTPIVVASLEYDPPGSSSYGFIFPEDAVFLSLE